MHSKYFQLTHFHYVLWANSFSNRCWNHRNKWISSINVSIEEIFVEKFCHEIRAIFADWVTSQQMFWPKLKLFARKLGAFFRDGNSIQCRFSILHNLQVLVDFFFLFQIISESRQLNLLRNLHRSQIMQNSNSASEMSLSKIVPCWIYPHHGIYH